MFFVFEGPDGVGKTSLAAEVQRLLRAAVDRSVVSYAFPGSEPGTLGQHLYAVHHDPEQFGIAAMTPASRQLLHVAAHIDAIDVLIRPGVNRGDIVLLDRYWWSTWVYGVTDGANRDTLRSMVELERQHWGDLRPAAVFLVRRQLALRPDQGGAMLARRSEEYEALAALEATHSNVVVVENDGSIEQAAASVMAVVRCFVQVQPV